MFGYEKIRQEKLVFLLEEAFNEENKKFKEDPQSFDGYVIGIIPFDFQIKILNNEQMTSFLRIKSFMYMKCYSILSIFDRKKIAENIIFEEIGAFSGTPTHLFISKKEIISGSWKKGFVI